MRTTLPDMPNQPGGISSQEDKVKMGTTLMPDMPNQPGGISSQEDKVNHRRCQDGSQADAHPVIQSTTKQVAVVRQVDLPVDSRVVQCLINYHPGQTQENEQPEGRPSLEEGDADRTRAGQTPDARKQQCVQAHNPRPTSPIDDTDSKTKPVNASQQLIPALCSSFQVWPNFLLKMCHRYD